ncbi:Ldh family oxidoreductase [Bacillus cereus]|uniref:Ldh family oxidoreductase n=1 Tax=Bacillus cereus TaxID=1396 RepID=UPI003556FFC3|nr:Ldh family oxidoreductase [Bacillus cereus]
MESTIFIDPKELEVFITKMFRSYNLKEADALISAKILVEANLWGTDSHGSSLLSTYLTRIKDGGINITPSIQTLWEKGGQILIDADGCIGPSVAYNATTKAITLAKEYGVSWVMVRNSNHIGMLGYYTRLITEAGLLGIVLTNSGPNVAAWGGVEAVLGNNAFSVGVPGSEFPPFLLDIATGEVACGRVRQHAERGEKIPEGWILNSNGESTTNPNDLIDGGVVLPFGKHKGFGIGMMVDLLTGVLSGGLFAANVNRQREDSSIVAGSSHTFIAFDFSQYISQDEWEIRINQWISMIKNSKKCDGVNEILIPGEKEKNTLQTRRKQGIPLSMKQIKQFISLAEEVNIEHPFKLAN